MGEGKGCLGLFVLAAAALLAPSGTAQALIAQDYLRVAVECPSDRLNGVLWTIDENKDGRQWRLSAQYVDGRLEKITRLTADAGKPFEIKESLDRASAIAKGWLPLFQAYEFSEAEVLRFYCYADAASQARYRAMLAANRDLLRSAGSGQ